MTTEISKRHEDADAITEFTAQNDGPPQAEPIGELGGFSWWAKEEATARRNGTSCRCGMHLCSGRGCYE